MSGASALRVGVCFAALTTVAADEGQLRWNPFERPNTEAATGRDTEVWRPVLRATLLDGAQSMANLGGVMLRIGEARGGYELVDVREWEAVFSRNGAQVVLRVQRAASPKRRR